MNESTLLALGHAYEISGFSDDEIDDIFLAHFGVKGMKWGHRKPRDEAARARQFGGKTKKPSRRERRAEARQERIRAGQKYATDLLNEAASRPNDTLILLNGRTIVTGEEFVNYMSNGGRLDVRTSRVYARRG